VGTLWLLAAEAMETFDSLFGGGRVRTYTLDTPLLVVSVASALVLLGLGVVRWLMRDTPRAGPPQRAR
jgi:hypothetical protein